MATFRISEQNKSHSILKLLFKYIGINVFLFSPYPLSVLHECAFA